MTDQLKSNLNVDETDATEGLSAHAPAKTGLGMPKVARIMLEDNPDIPPTGLFLGHNGVSYMLRPGIEMDVPEHILEVLDNAIMTVPIVNEQTRQVVGHRNRLKYSYRLLKRY